VKPAHSLLAALVVLGAALPAAAQEAKPVDQVALPVRAEAPVQHYPPPIVRLELIGVGLLITGGAWGASFASAVNWPTVPGSDQLKIPVVGPWIALGKSGCATDDPLCSGATVGVRGAIYVLDGIAQLAGLGLIVEAIVMKTETPKEKRAASIFSLRAGPVELRPVPITTPTMHGIGFVGTF
jgi:hypothetical protein